MHHKIRNKRPLRGPGRAHRALSKSPDGRLRRAVAEALEDRRMLSVTLVGVPDWDELGGAPLISASSTSDPNNPAGGAVEELVVDPSNPARMFAGSVNGGIWMTTDGNRPFDGVDNDGVNGTDDPGEQPTWIPLTDQFASLAIGDLRFDPTDATNNTLWAGTGSSSSFSSAGGLPIGVMRTTNGGTTWSVMPLSPGNEPRIRAVLPTGIDAAPGTDGLQQVVFAGTVRANDGLYRSIDGGNTFAEISGVNGLPNGPVTDLLLDPNNAGRVYAAVVGQGVFFSDDAGDNWTATDNATLSAAGSSVVQLTAHQGGGTTVWYTLVSGPNPAAFTSTDGGTNWTQLAAIPAAFASPTFNNLYTSRASDQIIVDPGNSDVVYITKGYGGSHVYRYDPSGPSWVQLESVAAVGNSSPHVDHRDVKFAGNNLIVANDGGLYFLNNPINPAGNRWTSLHGLGAGGLSAMEYSNTTWDSTFDVALGGAQDNGTSVQNGFLDRVWTSFRGADGGDVSVDTVNAGAGRTFRYSSTQNFGLTRHTFDSATNQPVAGVNLVPAGGLSGYTNFFQPLYELNRVDPARLVTGGSGTSPVYELLNAATATGGGDANWAAVPTGAGFGAVNSNFDAPMVYGGRLNGVNNAEVLIVGSGNRVFVRSTAGGTLTATPTAFPGGNVAGIAVDPENWQRMFVADGSGVWETPDAGTTWTNRTQNLANVNTRLQAIAFVPTAGGGVLLVGGNLGVSRLLLGLSDPQWTRLGGSFPNALLSDLEYHADDDVLLAGTFGRGAFLLQNAESAAAATSALIIEGDDDFPGQDDDFRLVLDQFNTAMLNVFENAVLVGSYVLDTIGQIIVNGLGGMDTLTVDSSFGLIDVPGGIRYDGGKGVDRLRLEQNGGVAQTSDVYSVGPSTGSGSSVISGATGTQSVFFENLEPVVDLVPSANLIVNGTPEHNAINYVQGALVTTGKVTIDNYESIEFANKVELRLNTGSGNDLINLNNPNQPASLNLISVFGDEGDDTVTTLSGLPAAVSLSAAGGVGHDLLHAAGAAGNATLTGGDGNDTLIGGAGNDSLAGDAGEDHLDGRGGNNTVTGGADTDTLLVTGTAGADAIGIADGDGGLFNITGGLSAGNNTISGVENASVATGTGADTLTLTLTGASNGLSYSALGGDPVASPADTLALVTSAGVTYTPGPGADNGSLAAATANATSVSFGQFEALSVSGGGALIAAGSGGNDAITVVAATGGAADGTRDFTLSVNGAAGALFIDTPSLTINALGGEDTITVRAPAAGADWNVNLTVNGGPPSAADRLIVETPGLTVATYSATSANGGSLTIFGTADDSIVTIVDIEQLIYDGMSGNDALTVNGTGGDNAVLHTPGSANDAGTIAVDSLLAVAYQNLGAGGSATIDGGAGTNTLSVRGTSVGDAFTVDAAGTINLNARVPLNTAGFAQVALEGLAGDDTFTLTPEVAASPFATLLLNGGGQASSTGDRAFLSGTGGDDAFVLSGQNVSADGRNVNGTGVENFNLTLGAGGGDSLTYDGVAGAQDTVNITGSSSAGGGQLAVAGVTNYTFSGVEVLFANGQDADGDTLAFTGTNNPDTFNIDTRVGPGGGSAGSPVLNLQSSSDASSLLLTLADYTGFATLKVYGLDGADVFNVYTGPTGGRSLFLDGGLPTAKKKATDKLRIFYDGRRPSITHSTARQNPGSGLVDLDYGTSRTLVQYADMEEVTISKL